MTSPNPQVDLATMAREHYAAQRAAMVVGDADRLADLLGDDFTLTHMTGHVQSAAEWVADVRSGAMSYHSIEDVEVGVEVVEGVPVVTARSRTTATIWGTRGRWPLQLRITLAHDGADWRAAHTVASVWGDR